jgi:outer membrane protein insertion porin family
VGELKVEGNSIFSEQQVLAYVGSAERRDRQRQTPAGRYLRRPQESLRLAGICPVQRRVQSRVQGTIRTIPRRGIVDISITIDEGRQFTLRRLEFSGNTFTRDKVLRREFLLNEGDIYNQNSLDISVARLNQTQYFDPIEKDRDVEIRADDEKGDVDLTVHVKEKGRQQISFNGGIAGIGGNVFLASNIPPITWQGAARSCRSAPASVTGSRACSSVTSSRIFVTGRYRQVSRCLPAAMSFLAKVRFSRRTPVSSRLCSIRLALLATDNSNLFTQKTIGANVFATAPLSEFFFKKRRFTQFSRIGLTYQISGTSIADPEVNASGDPSRRVPVIYRQPNIITSQVTGTFVYDTRQPARNGIDTLSGKQLALSFGFAGLLGDVRTYQPSVTFSHFIPIRNKKSPNPHVFAYRILAGTIGAWSITDKIANANSISFVAAFPLIHVIFWEARTI